jgi:hypothetical protein
MLRRLRYIVMGLEVRSALELNEMNRYYASIRRGINFAFYEGKRMIYRAWSEIDNVQVIG